MKYMREGLDDKYGLLKLQDKILEIMVYIDTICREYQIEYCLMGGSALGAVRHGGFIPWDDDLDIFMSPESYERFRSVFLKKGDKNKYYLQEWGRYGKRTIFAKLRLNNTLYIEPALRHRDMHQGIYVDIFMLHRCSDNVFLRYYQYIWARYITVKRLANTGYHKRGGGYLFLLSLLRRIPYNFLVRYAFRQICMSDHKKTKYYCNFSGKAHYKNGLYECKYFDQPVYRKFETVELKCPDYIEEFLKTRFGDYMKIPSENKIKWEQHALVWNTNIATKNRGFSEEKTII